MTVAGFETSQQNLEIGQVKSARWQIVNPPDAPGLGYCCDIVLKEDSAGGYTASVAQLRGVVSQGDNAETAMTNVIEALTLALATYNEEGMPIPWIEAGKPQPGERVYRVAVNV